MSKGIINQVNFHKVVFFSNYSYLCLDIVLNWQSIIICVLKWSIKFQYFGEVCYQLIKIYIDFHHLMLQPSSSNLSLSSSTSLSLQSTSSEELLISITSCIFALLAMTGSWVNSIVSTCHNITSKTWLASTFNSSYEPLNIILSCTIALIFFIKVIWKCVLTSEGDLPLRYYIGKFIEQSSDTYFYPDQNYSCVTMGLC